MAIHSIIFASHESPVYSVPFVPPPSYAMPPTSEGNILHFSNYIHQLAANFVCLQFGAGQIMYSGFWEFFLWKDNTRWHCI